MILPPAMSWLMTLVNSVRPSLDAPLCASFRSWERRASDSMMRSSTVSCAIVLAACWFIDGSNAVTFESSVTDGIGGSVHTRPDAETGVDSPGAGSAESAALVIQYPTG